MQSLHAGHQVKSWCDMQFLQFTDSTKKKKKKKKKAIIRLII